MSDTFKNTGYFLKEVMRILRTNLATHLFSLVSTLLIFFLLAMSSAGWYISQKVLAVIENEAEVHAYYADGLDRTAVDGLLDKIRGIDGVREARVVDEAEAYARMETVLGRDARVLGFFEDNPFSAFLEIKIQLEQLQAVAADIGAMAGIDYVRDNLEILERLRAIAVIIRGVGLLVIAAVAAATLVTLMHIIRQGIYSCREQIHTLRLLGAPETFIGLPFVLEGLTLTLLGGAGAAVLSGYALQLLYRQMSIPLPFIPLPPLDTYLFGGVLLLLCISALLGLLGSLFGLLSAKSRH